MRTLVFTYDFSAQKVATGRELLARLNCELLVSILGTQNVLVYKSPPKGPTTLQDRVRTIFGWIDGLTKNVAASCVEMIRKENIDVVYIEGSNYGRLAREIRSAKLDCTVVTFFHNVESKFFLDALKCRPSLRALGVLFANYLAERDAVRHSTQVLCLTEADAHLLKRLYKARTVHIFPMALSAEENPQLPIKTSTERKPCALFVGGAFYANVEGMIWFARNVSPLIPYPIYVVGRGFDSYKAEFERFHNIEVIGPVSDLAIWYRQASVVIAPIFSGSGMKTKVAEALKFGRPVVGSPGAFIGYDKVHSQAGYVCVTAVEYAEAITAVCSGRVTYDESILRKLYKENYSQEAARKRFESLMTTWHSPPQGGDSFVNTSNITSD